MKAKIGNYYRIYPNDNDVSEVQPLCNQCADDPAIEFTLNCDSIGFWEKMEGDDEDVCFCCGADLISAEADANQGGEDDCPAGAEDDYNQGF